MAGLVGAGVTLEVERKEATAGGAPVVGVPMVVMENTTHMEPRSSVHWAQLRRWNLPRRERTPHRRVPHMRRRIG